MPPTSPAASRIVRPTIRKLKRRWPGSCAGGGEEGGPASNLGSAGAAATLPSSVDLRHTDNPVRLGPRFGIIASSKAWRNMYQCTKAPSHPHYQPPNRL